MSGATGSGILVVTGTLTISGVMQWNGLILVIGDGSMVVNGAGNGVVYGEVFVANTHGAGGTLEAHHLIGTVAARLVSITTVAGLASATTCITSFSPPAKRCTKSTCTLDPGLTIGSFFCKIPHLQGCNLFLRQG